MNFPLVLWDAARYGLLKEIRTLAGVLDFARHPELAALALAPAAYAGHVTCVRELLKYIKKSMPGADGALNAATKGGHHHCVRELIPFCSAEAVRHAIVVGERQDQRINQRMNGVQLALRLLRTAVDAELIAWQHPNVGANLAIQG